MTFITWEAFYAFRVGPFRVDLDLWPPRITYTSWDKFPISVHIHIHNHRQTSGPCLVTCLKKYRDRPPAEKPQWKIAFNWNSSLSRRSQSGQLETHHCQNLSPKDMDTKWKCPGHNSGGEGGRCCRRKEREQQKNVPEEALSKHREAPVRTGLMGHLEEDSLLFCSKWT